MSAVAGSEVKHDWVFVQEIPYIFLPHPTPAASGEPCPGIVGSCILPCCSDNVAYFEFDICGFSLWYFSQVFFGAQSKFTWSGWKKRWQFKEQKHLVLIGRFIPSKKVIKRTFEDLRVYRVMIVGLRQLEPLSMLWAKREQSFLEEARCCRHAECACYLREICLIKKGQGCPLGFSVGFSMCRIHCEVMTKDSEGMHVKQVTWPVSRVKKDISFLWLSSNGSEMPVEPLNFKRYINESYKSIKYFIIAWTRRLAVPHSFSLV